jgi:hypothetical protein
MGEAEQFERIDLSRGEAYQGDPGRQDSGRNDLAHGVPTGREPLPRAVGSPLPAGLPGKPLPTGPGDGQPSRTAAQPLGRALTAPAHSEAEQSPGMQWVVGALKQAVPFMQRLLPLIDTNIAAAFANLLTPHSHTPPPAPRVDLAPIENGLTELQLQHRDLRGQVIEQNSSLKRVEDQLDMVREATDRNTLEQQELIEDLKTMANRVNLVAALLIGLLVVSVLLNLFLFLHIQRVLP